MSSSKKEFISEAEELLGEAEEHLIELQDSAGTGFNPDTVNALFRSIHTLKGISGLFGLEGLKDLSHAIEEILDSLRLGNIEVTDDVIRCLFKNIDILRELLKKAGQGNDFDVTPYLKDIELFGQRTSSRQKQESLSGIIDEAIISVLSNYEEQRLRANIKKNRALFIINAVFSLEDFDKALAELTEKIKKEGELISILPTSEDMPPDSIGFKLLFASDKNPDSLKISLGITPEQIAGRRTEKTTDRKTQPSLKSISTTVRVDIEKLDRILNTIGELALAREAIKRIEDKLSGIHGHSELVFDMHRASRGLERRLSELQQQVLEIRMVPIGQIFLRLAQIVKRYSQEIGKPVDLTVFGEETELDKFIAEEIVDPLMHIVRNAMDHGIESPEERKRRGKPERGTIKVKAFQRGNNVIVEIEDDGRGIDMEMIRRKAVEKGIITAGKEIDDTELTGFIFRAGFSTKETVTEVSGRGVGMDVVKDRISSIGGFVNIRTEKDIYTQFSLSIPITLAIIKSLLVRVGINTFALPLSSISETLIVGRDDLQSIEGKKVYNLRGELLPVMPVSDFFEPGSRNHESGDQESRYIVVSGYGERRVGLLVDELIGGQEIVIKSLGGYLEGLKGFAGVTEIGRHNVILVIDVETLTEEILLRHKGLVHV
ncbi:Signal transduction histidine kinase CheA [hydrothermal vent metagenome]|uniref:histidine kinase n=1 Tax=hydrothermal vent metagenome TaxID=652676 RepID=A0A3B1DBL6_9ZZZZ